jgi:hypothetical protein
MLHVGERAEQARESVRGQHARDTRAILDVDGATARGKQKQSTRDEGGEWALCSHLLCTVKEKSRQFEGRQTRQR